MSTRAITDGEVRPFALSARTGPLLARLTILLALVIHAPALAAPFVLDDYAQYAMTYGTYPGTGAAATDAAPVPRAFDLYNFINDTNRQELVERGIVPWWTHPTLVVRFFRPLASALLWADHRVFGHHPLWHHVHSLLWWIACVAMVRSLLRGLLPSRIANLGAAVYALAPCHALPLVWLANREVLVSTAIGTAALGLYCRWREGGRVAHALASALLFALAMTAGEYTLCFAGYVVAIEVVTGGPPLRRAMGVAPFILPAAGYLWARSAMGYGARGAGFYHDPLSHFGEYVQSAPRRFAVLFDHAWLGLDDVAWGGAPWGALLGAACVVAGLLVAPVVASVRALDPEPRRRATWLLAGSLLSLAPVMAVQPSARLLAVCMIGVSPIIAIVIDRAWFPPAPQPRAGLAELTGVVAILLAFAHLVRAPLDTWLATRLAKNDAIQFDKRMRWIRDHAEGRSTVVVVRAVSPSATLFAPLVLGSDAPDRWRILTFLPGHCLLFRTGERTIDIVAGKVPPFPVGPENLFRDLHAPFHAGDRVTLGGMTVRVLQVDERAIPRRLRFEFDRDPDDPSLLWVVEDLDGFHESKLPPKGFGEPLD
ncbi:MAG TPA: hypothetical protein VKU41_18510 [Polyangiaceae bacterium]|nr:hypothetical protein [Polyangiaceae bacterium]